MVGGPGPFDYITMGGLFTILKVRENLTSYDDPGWYQHPPGMMPGSSPKPHRAKARQQQEALESERQWRKMRWVLTGFLVSASGIALLFLELCGCRSLQAAVWSFANMK